MYTSKWLVLYIVIMGIFISAFNNSIVKIANPFIADSFNISITEVQWVVTAYMTVTASTLLLFGRMGDNYGAKYLYIIACFLFTIGSVVCYFANSLGILIAGRLIQAFGGSLIIATSIGLLAAAFPLHERGKAIGILASAVGIATASAPFLGGLIITKFDWPALFLLSIPISLLTGLMSIRYLPQAILPEKRHNLDLAGSLLFSLLIVTIVLSINVNSNFLLLAITLGILLWQWEKRQPDPLIDAGIFANKSITICCLMLFINYFCQMFAMFLMPFFFVRAWALDASLSGLLIMLNPLVTIILAPIAGFWSDRYGSRRLIVIAYAFLVSSFLCFSLLGLHSPWWVAALGMIMLGCGVGFFASPNSRLILSMLPPDKQNYGGGLLGFVRNLSFVLGAASASKLNDFFVSRHAGLELAQAYAIANQQVFTLLLIFLCFGLSLAIYDLFRKHSA